MTLCSSSVLLTLEEAAKLETGSLIYHRDGVGRFLKAKVKSKENTRLLIHYQSWRDKWDCWSDYNTELHRFARRQTTVLTN